VSKESSTAIEERIIEIINELQAQSRFCDAAIADMSLFNAKGYLPELREALAYAEELLLGVANV
jgi:hypothetical protein